MTLKFYYAYFLLLQDYSIVTSKLAFIECKASALISTVGALFQQVTQVNCWLITEGWGVQWNAKISMQY